MQRQGLAEQANGGMYSHRQGAGQVLEAGEAGQDAEEPREEQRAQQEEGRGVEEPVRGFRR